MKRNQVNMVSMEVAVGAFLFMILLALSVFTILLSQENIFQRYYRYEIQFPEVLGIRDGDNVLLHGVSVGKIRKVEVSPPGVQVEISLSRELVLHTDYRFEILTTSVLGGRSLNVDEGSAGLALVSKDTPLVGRAPVDLIDQATRTVEIIKTALEKDRILENLGESMKNVRQVSDSLSRGEGTLGKLLVDNAVYEDLKAITANLKGVSEQLSKGQSSLGRLLSDEGTIYEDVQTITKNLKETTDRLNSGEGTLGKLLSKDDTLYNDLQKSVASIRGIVQTVEAGEGTLGRLVKDPALYDNTVLLVDELRVTLDDFRETSPITTFATVLFGAF